MPACFGAVAVGPAATHGGDDAAPVRNCAAPMNPPSRTFHPLERVDRLHDGYVRAFDVAGLHLVLVQQGGVPAVLEGYCPHAGHPLDGARVVGTDLRCDMHGYRFDAHSGRCTYWTEGPCRALVTYECEVREAMVGVWL